MCAIQRMNEFQIKQSEPTVTTDTAPETNSNASSPKNENTIAEIIRFTIIALIIVVPIRMFIAQPFIVSGASMEDSFQNGEYLIVDQLTYQFESPKRGEVVIFRYPRDASKYFIKRVVGVPGDTITINGAEVTIKNQAHPEGITLAEPYIASMSENTFLTEELGEDEYFVMGDNRDQSSDSRMWGILHEDKIVGRAFLRLFPIGSIASFPGAYDSPVGATEFNNPE